MNGTKIIVEAALYPYTSLHDGNAHRIPPLFHRPAGSGRPGSHPNRSRPHRHEPCPPRGLGQALATVREGDTLVVTKLDRPARSVPDARAIADQLREYGVKLALGRALYDPGDPMVWSPFLDSFSPAAGKRHGVGRPPPARRRRYGVAASTPPGVECSPGSMWSARMCWTW